MSRFILIPGSESFELIPFDQSRKRRKVYLPNGLFVDMGVFNQVHEQEELKKLLHKLSRTEISRMSNGKVKNGHTCLDINFDRCIVSCCDGNFNQDFNEFYSVLKFNGITL